MSTGKLAIFEMSYVHSGSSLKVPKKQLTFTASSGVQLLARALKMFYTAKSAGRILLLFFLKQLPVPFDLHVDQNVDLLLIRTWPASR